MIRANDVILFQGDSITDAGRGRQCLEPNDPTGLGRGYVFFAAGDLLARRPNDNLRIYNRGVGGDKVWQLEDRWRSDCLELRPDVLSILIGVNDTWHGQNDPALRVPLDRYDQTYRRLLDSVRATNPEVRLVLCEPFVLRTGAVTESWFPEIDRRRAIVGEIASDYQATLVPFQTLFDALGDTSPAPYWLRDGVHPTLAGHHRMATAWLDAVDENGPTALSCCP